MYMCVWPVLHEAGFATHFGITCGLFSGVAAGILGAKFIAGKAVLSVTLLCLVDVHMPSWEQLRPALSCSVPLQPNTST
jgi:hypothetical protein